MGPRNSEKAVHIAETLIRKGITMTSKKPKDSPSLGSQKNVHAGAIADQETIDRAMAVFDKERCGGIDIKDAIEAAESLGQAGDPRFVKAEADGNWVAIPAGKFLMGAQKQDPKEPNYDNEAYDNESPVRKVTLSEYHIGRYLVTVGEYERFVEAGGYVDETYWKSGGFGEWKEPGEWAKQREYPTRPVLWISWNEAKAYANWASTVLRQVGRDEDVCLPTEAQWERAARGTEGRRFPWGNTDANPSLLNYADSRISHSTPVGVYPHGSTPDGITDLAGNVWEWCADWSGDDYYAKAKSVDPRGPDSGTTRILRGGCWANIDQHCRSANHYRSGPGNRIDFIGFRVVLNLK